MNVMDFVKKFKNVLSDCEIEIERCKKGVFRMECNIKVVEEEVYKNVEEFIMKLRLYE